MNPWHASTLQVCSALPKLQVLDEVKLGRPLSPVFKPAHPLRQTYSAAAVPEALSWPATVNSFPTQSTTALTSSAFFEASSDVAHAVQGLPMPPQHARSDAMFLKPNRRPGRQRRPASAGGLQQQRLPPVALGHNQPGSYLLYSLDQLPPDVMITAQTDLTAAVPRSVFRPPGLADNEEDLQTAGCAQSLGTDATEDTLSISSGRVESRKLTRPASAGIRRAESRLQSPSPSDSSR